MGWKPDVPDFRDLKYVRPSLITLPDVVDLRKQCPAPYNQLNLGSCTAQAIAGVIEYRETVQRIPNPQTPSRLFIYYNERILEDSVNQDSGATLRNGIKSLVRWGYCEEEYWKYDPARYRKRPPKEAYKDAVKSRIKQYERISHSVTDMKHCLAAGNPFVFGFAVFESFDDEETVKTGKMKMPLKNERMCGAHAVTAVGFNNTQQVFIVRNSWGADWGDKGYFYMPYEFISNPDLADDFWTISFVPNDD